MNFRLVLTTFLFALIVHQATAQDVSRRWGIGVGIGLKDYDNLPVDGSFDFNAMSPAIYAHLGRVLVPSWEVQLSTLIPIPNYSYFSALEPTNQANFHLHYRLNNGYLLKANNGFGPYLTAGVSGSFRDFQDSAYILSIPVGLGFRLQPAKAVSFHLSGHYHLAAVANRAQPQVSFQAGFTVHLGKSKSGGDENIDGDQDGDGVKDSRDLCPTVAGLKKFKGCPDSDSDGVPDNIDKCKNLAGIAKNKGCPAGDDDQDGFVGEADQCPTISGTAKGCPDFDDDGIPDREDDCPRQPGSLQAKGCPDRDQDGIPDDKDRCPDEYGLLEYEGCSLSPFNHEEALRKIAQNIRFVRKSSRLLLSGESAVEELATYLKDNPDKRVKLSVFTDNKGELYQLYRLSQQRAETCRLKLERSGIPPSRIFVQGYGSFSPKEDNFSPGKGALNNRVEITLIQN